LRSPAKDSFCGTYARGDRVTPIQDHHPQYGVSGTVRIGSFMSGRPGFVQVVWDNGALTWPKPEVLRRA
jgi:hypothetical protein